MTACCCPGGRSACGRAGSSVPPRTRSRRRPGSAPPSWASGPPPGPSSCRHSSSSTWPRSAAGWLRYATSAWTSAAGSSLASSRSVRCGRSAICVACPACTFPTTWAGGCAGCRPTGSPRRGWPCARRSSSRSGRFPASAASTSWRPGTSRRSLPSSAAPGSLSGPARMAPAPTGTAAPSPPDRGDAVLIDVRPVAKLTGPDPLDVAATLGPVFGALSPARLDLATLRVVCDWIQYRHNFYEPVQARPVLADRPHRPERDGDKAPPETALEIALDLRRCNEPGDVAASVAAALATRGTETGQVLLEPWQPASESCLWRFNTLYWQALSRWEEATGREYEQALPGGKSQARNTDTADDLIRQLLRVWDELDARRALPEELYVVELGVGNGSQARTWLDEFARLDYQHGRDYYRRLHYLMGDYSAHVLDRARKAVAHHGDKVSSLVLDATRPQLTLGFLRGKAFCVYISNVYDNLPTDDVAAIRGRPYLVEVRAYLRRADAARIARRHHVKAGELAPLVHRLLRLGPDLLAEAAPDRFAGPHHTVSFWRDVWAALRLAERYVPLDGLDAYQVSPGVTGEILRPLLEGRGDVRMHVSNGALASFAGTLPLLHPFGQLYCHDLFLTGPDAYHTGFPGPGKYDGSVVNWVNGPLLALTGNRRGFDVQIAPLSGHPEANVKTLTAQVRD